MNQSWRRWWIQITADKRRFGLLCATVTVGLLLWARLIIVSRVPRTAIAEEAVPAADNVSAAGMNGAAARKRPVKVELTSTPTRDPFVISPTHFPKPTPPAKTGEDSPKSPIEPADIPEDIEARITRRLQALVNELQLEAVLGESMAVIDGKRYRVGQAIAQTSQDSTFVLGLIEIRHRSVILECEGRRFELHMAAPGEH